MFRTDQSFCPSVKELVAVPHRYKVGVSFEEFALDSHFQPVLSLSAQRPVGYEALLRARGANGISVSPLELFRDLSSSKRMELDSLTHRMHLENFGLHSDQSSWLFLNMSPDVFLRARYAPSGYSFGDLLSCHRVPANKVVVEVLEEAVRDSAAFESAVAFFRELGCLIALDDFGAGSSNFDRIWKIRPQIVKLDRSLILEAAKQKRVRRILPQLISLLHEAGAMVIVEGIETVDEAYIALDANADFAQGFFFGRPQATIVDETKICSAVQDVWLEFDTRVGEERYLQKNAIAPYTNAIGNASVLLSAGRLMGEACASFFELSESSICYLLDDQGQQIGINLWGEKSSPKNNPRLAPLNDTRNARWSRCPYFRRAMENFGKVQVTRPYFSIASASMCVTVSVSFRHENKTYVICGDVCWESSANE